MKVIQFGAGNIGRGFMAQLYAESGYEILFVDSNASLVDRLNEQTSYTLFLLDAYSKREEPLLISNYHALSTTQVDDVSLAFAEAHCVSTAVGVGNLDAVAPLIAAGIAERMKRNNSPIDIFLCENLYGAFLLLKKAVAVRLDANQREWMEKNVGFVGTSVARMVPAADPRFTKTDPLAVAADAYHHLPYDLAAAKAGRAPVEAMDPVANFKAEVERKLFTHNLGHAALAYIGYRKGHQYVSDALLDPEIRSIFDAALAETSAALLSKYPEDLDEDEHKRILTDVAVRFGNPMLRDTVYRVGRDPIRKLGPDDRLIGSARLCLEQGIAPTTIAGICVAALHYDYAGDSAAVRLQDLLSCQGLHATLSKVCGLEPGDRLFQMIDAVYCAA